MLIVVGCRYSWTGGSNPPRVHHQFKYFPRGPHYLLVYSNEENIMNIDLVCSLCERPFTKPKNEYTRRKKLGQEKFYCSRKCGGKQENALKNISKNWGKNNHLLKRGSYFGDEFTPFRPHMRRVRRRGKKYDLTLEDLKMQWFQKPPRQEIS